MMVLIQTFRPKKRVLETETSDLKTENEETETE